MALTLTACDQPAEAPVETPTAVAEAAPTGGEQLASIDVDGNVAPFGFAAKKPVPVPEKAAEAEVAMQVAASSALYGTHCVACHGADAKGVQGLGLNLVESQLVASSSADDLAAFCEAA